MREKILYEKKIQCCEKATTAVYSPFLCCLSVSLHSGKNEQAQSATLVLYNIKIMHFPYVIIAAKNDMQL